MSVKAKTLLIIGVILFVASPFLFYYTPGWITPLLCTPNSGDFFSCSGEAFYTGVIALTVALSVGTGLILLALRSKK